MKNINNKANFTIKIKNVFIEDGLIPKNFEFVSGLNELSEFDYKTLMNNTHFSRLMNSKKGYLELKKPVESVKPVKDKKENKIDSRDKG